MKKLTVRCLTAFLAFLIMCATSCSGSESVDTQGANNGNSGNVKPKPSVAEGKIIDISSDCLILVFESNNKIIAELPIVDSQASFVEDGIEYNFTDIKAVFDLLERKKLIDLTKKFSNLLNISISSTDDSSNNTIPDYLDMDGDGVAETPLIEGLRTVLAYVVLYQYYYYIPLVPDDSGEWVYSHNDGYKLIFKNS